MATDLHLGEAWIGPLGSMVRLPYVSSMEVDPSRPNSEFRSATGTRRMQFAQRGARQWQVSLPGYYSDEIGQLFEFLDATPGPHYWVDPVARAVNLLHPDCASLASAAVTVGTIGPSNTGWDLLPGQMVTTTSPTWRPARQADIGKSGILRFVQPGGTAEQKIPVVPGVPVVVSAYILRTAANQGVTFHIYAYDKGGVPISAPSLSKTVYGPIGVQRDHVVINEAPANAVYVVVRFASPSPCSLFRPAVTWTRELRPWGPGMGAPSVAAAPGVLSPKTAFVQGDANSTFDVDMSLWEVS